MGAAERRRLVARDHVARQVDRAPADPVGAPESLRRQRSRRGRVTDGELEVANFLNRSPSATSSGLTDLPGRWVTMLHPFAQLAKVSVTRWTVSAGPGALGDAAGDPALVLPGDVSWQRFRALVVGRLAEARAADAAAKRVPATRARVEDVEDVAAGYVVPVQDRSGGRSAGLHHLLVQRYLAVVAVPDEVRPDRLSDRDAGRPQRWRGLYERRLGTVCSRDARAGQDSSCTRASSRRRLGCRSARARTSAARRGLVRKTEKAVLGHGRRGSWYRPRTLALTRHRCTELRRRDDLAGRHPASRA